jgi:ABC-2 type transport system ATP-binding protein
MDGISAEYAVDHAATVSARSEPVVTVRGLVKRYGSREAVAGIDLEVRRGEIFAFLGPNGAGKTTTVEILEGFRQRTGGQVSVLGHDPATASGAWRDRVGVVLQESQPEPGVTVREYLALYAGFYRAPRDIDETIALVGLTEKAGALGTRLSGGQRRRLDFALALIGDPELIFLDEPTTGFDPSARRAAWEVVAGLRQLGKTIFLTTHYMDEAEYLADRITVLSAGRIVAEGTPQTLGGRDQMPTAISFTLPDHVQPRDLPPALSPRTGQWRERVKSRKRDSPSSSTPSGGPSPGAAHSSAQNAEQPSRQQVCACLAALIPDQRASPSWPGGDRVAQAIGREQRLEGPRVPYRVRVTVVVEVDVHVLAGQTPFPDPVSPPLQVRIGVRAGVQVIVIRAVHPHVHEIGSGAQHARQVRPAHHAIRRPVFCQQRESRFAVPATVSELHRHPNPFRDQPQEICQPSVIARLRGRQLDQQYRPLIAQFVPALPDTLQPCLRRV